MSGRSLGTVIYIGKKPPNHDRLFDPTLPESVFPAALSVARRVCAVEKKQGNSSRSGDRILGHKAGGKVAGGWLGITR
jgi:hypothetical protein